MMTTRTLKNNGVRRILLLLGVSLVTTLALLIGIGELHIPSFSPLSVARAMMLQSTCASTQGTQQNLCDQQNPLAQGCTQDAQTIEAMSVFTRQNTLIGEVDLRYSNVCKAYWVLTIAYANALQVQAIDATISFHDGKVQDHPNNPTQPGVGLAAFTDMTQQIMFPNIGAGVFHLHGQTLPMTIPL